MNNQVSYDALMEKWAPVLNEESAGAIKDSHRKAVTAAILENQEIALREEGVLNETNNTSTVTSGVTANWNPVLIALVRRAMPNLMAYDICGVQPMSGPTGLIFAMKSTFQKTKSGTSDGAEALFNEANINFSGDSGTTAMETDPSGMGSALDGDNDSTIADSLGDPLANLDLYTTAEAEALGVSGGEQFR